MKNIFLKNPIHANCANWKNGEKIFLASCWKMNLLAVIFSVLFCSCSKSTGIAFKTSSNSKTELKIATWNVQTFFDAVNDGNEYSEFRKSNKWNTAAYEMRLEKLCSAIKKLDAEVYVLEEIENERIIYDITNRLAGNTWYKNKKLNYAVFAKDSASSIGCAVLSRHQLSDVSVHATDIRTEKNKQPAMRPLIEATVTKNGRNIILYVNHWKSKSGGKEETEVWRTWQESVLAGRIVSVADGTSISCGDFNRDIADFMQMNSATDDDIYFGNDDFSNKSESQPANTTNIFLRHRGFEKEKKVAAYSPWLDEIAVANCDSQGSYYYKGNWECIDHFFSTGNANIKNFKVATDEPFTKKDGTPNKYAVYAGKGTSDHLPLVCIVEF